MKRMSHLRSIDATEKIRARDQSICAHPTGAYMSKRDLGLSDANRCL